eukprot:scaffold63441_cov31-Tisochrysis_lutea.AAC.2
MLMGSGYAAEARASSLNLRCLILVPAAIYKPATIFRFPPPVAVGVQGIPKAPPTSDTPLPAPLIGRSNRDF